MTFLEELLFLMQIGRIGKTAVNREFFPWRKALQTQEMTGSAGNCPDLLPEQNGSGTVRFLSGPESVPDRTGGEGSAACLFPDRGSENAAEEWLLRSGRELTDREREKARRGTWRVMEWLQRHPGVRACTIFDREYPAQLRDMGSRRPPVLFIRGAGFSGKAGAAAAAEAWAAAVRVLNGPSLAVIGARWPCGYTLRRGPAFARTMAERAGMTIVSGLARGCDRIGHTAAMDAGLPTVAVMPCGPERIVPECNRDLASRILEENGLLITEYPPDTPPAEYRYTERDRITAALSSAAAVIDCEEKSGTMLTAQAAADLGRPVGCWDPENCGQEGFTGNRFMIKQLGAYGIRDELTLDAFLNRIPRSGRGKQEESCSVQLSLF